jgi:hypothetical protein
VITCVRNCCDQFDLDSSCSFGFEPGLILTAISIVLAVLAVVTQHWFTTTVLYLPYAWFGSSKYHAGLLAKCTGDAKGFDYGGCVWCKADNWMTFIVGII